MRLRDFTFRAWGYGRLCLDIMEETATDADGLATTASDGESESKVKDGDFFATIRLSPKSTTLPLAVPKDMLSLKCSLYHDQVFLESHALH